MTQYIADNNLLHSTQRNLFKLDPILASALPSKDLVIKDKEGVECVRKDLLFKALP
jgi:hypothetical protein